MTFRVSSRLTLFLKLALPIFWLSIMAFATIAIFYLKEDGGPMFSTKFRVTWLIFYVSFGIILYKSIFQLMRVEVDHEFIYISNFIKTIKLPYEAIKEIHENNTGLFQVIKLNFQQPTYFGNSSFFLASRKHYPQFVEEFSSQLKHLIK